MTSLLAGASSIAQAAEEKAIRPARERIIEGWLIAGSSEDEGRRKVSMNQIDEGGWPSFVDNRAKDVYDWGVRRFWLHNPFGTVPGQVMQFDQYPGCAVMRDLDMCSPRTSPRPGRPVVTRGSFGEPDRAHRVSSGRRIRPTIDCRRPSTDRQRPRRFLGTMLACVKPLLHGRAVRSVRTRPSGSPTMGRQFMFYKYLESIGVPVYVESRDPSSSQPSSGRSSRSSRSTAWWKRSDPEALNPDCGRPGRFRIRGDASARWCAGSGTIRARARTPRYSKTSSSGPGQRSCKATRSFLEPTDCEPPASRSSVSSKGSTSRWGFRQEHPQVRGLLSHPPRVPSDRRHAAQWRRRMCRNLMPRRRRSRRPVAVPRKVSRSNRRP